MSDDFRVGDIVECVDLSPSENRAYPLHIYCLILGGLYTISAIRPRCPASGHCGLDLREQPAASRWGYRASRFRLVHRPRQEFLTELRSAPVDLTEKPERVHEPASGSHPLRRAG